MPPGASLAAWLSYLEGLHPTSIDMGLERVAEVARRLEIAVLQRVITVTGTNGKGTCAAALEALGRAHGLRVAVYTSPHLLRYNERIRVDSEEISDSLLVSAFERIEAARGDISLTYFEFGTLAALLCFADARVDLVVLEVGLGGRLDAVNIIDADVAVMTSIDLDHQQYLGDTREAVCFEKAGIRRAGRPLVCGDPAPPPLLDQLCLDSGSPLLKIGRDFRVDKGNLSVAREAGHGVSVDIDNPALIASNLACALQAFVLVHPAPDASLCAKALSGVRIPGRRQRLRDGPGVFVDVGHNPHAAAELARWWVQQASVPGRRWAIVGMLSDKDVNGTLEPLVPVVDHWVTVDLPPPRGLSAAVMASALQALGQQVAGSAQTPVDGLNFVLEHASPDDSVIIFGSFLMVSEILARHD